MITAVAVIVIFVAVIFSLFRIAIPYVTNYGDTIETELSRQLDMRVEIEGVDADIQWLTPRLNLLGVKIYDPRTHRLVFSFAEINLGLGWLQSFRELAPELGFVSIEDFDLRLERRVDGSMNVQGYAFSPDETDIQLPRKLFRMLEKSSIYIVDSQLHWTDQKHNAQRLELKNFNLALINDAPGHRLSVEMDMPEQYGRHLKMIFDIEGPLDQVDTWKGKVYASVQELKLQKWLDDYWEEVSFSGNGIVDANLWIEWDGRTVREINAFVDAGDMALHYLENDVRSWKLDRFTGTLRWIREDHGWSVDGRGIQMQRNDREWPNSSSLSITVDDARQLVSTRATFVRLEDVAYLGGLVTSFVPIKDFDWNRMFDTYQPRGDLYDVDVRVPTDAPRNAVINGRFTNLGYQTDGNFPAARGLDGSLSYEGNSTMLELDSRKVELDYRGLFRNSLVLEKLSGDIELYNRDQAWHLNSDELRLATQHLETRTRIAMRVPQTGGPFIDLVTRFSKGDGRHKSLYFPTAVMPAKTVEWLDRAIVTADIPQGGFLFYGAVDDYPFDAGEGVMQAVFDVEHAKIQYLDDWPGLEGMKASVRFHNRSLQIRDAEGRILGATFNNTRVDISDMESASLDIAGYIKTPLPELFEFVRQSPLKEKLGSALNGVESDGNAEMDLSLHIPLHDKTPVDVGGTLYLQGNRLAFPENNYRIEALQGELAFTRHSIDGSELKGQLGDHPIDISVATLEKDGRFRVKLAGKMNVDDLLSPVPRVAEYLDGSAHFDVRIDIPGGADAPKLAIDVESDLQGVSTRFPGCYAKTADRSGAFRMSMGLYPSETLEAKLSFDSDYTVEARREQQRWFVKVDSCDLVGNARFMQDLSQQSPFQLNIDYINAGSLFGADRKTADSESEDAGRGLSPTNFPPLRVQIRKLEWGSYHFSDIGLETERSDTGMVINHFEAHAPTVNIMGKGSWLTSWRFDDSTVVDFTVDTHDLGKTLSQFEITDAIRNTDGKATVHWTWPAKPYEFDWDIVRGRASLDLEDGKVRNVDVGAGRLIGILNFETLLSLDFGNQVSSGFAFDQVSGDIRFDAGHAHTREVTIESKVAEIILDGRIGLSDEDYDQTITVIPGVGSTLTVIGAVTGGPATAAAVHLFRKLFGLDRIAKYTYSVTGTWDEPRVRLLSAPDEDATTEKTDE